MDYLLLFFALFSFVACDKSEDAITPTLPPADCGRSIEVLPAGNWGDGPALTGATVETIDGLCMVINYTYVGCSDQGLPLRLLTEGNVAESLPTQTRAALRFSVPQGGSLCAVFENQRDTFDLSAYLEGSLPTLLTIEGADTTVLIGEE